MKFKLNKNNTKLILIESTREEYLQLSNWLSPYVKGYRFMPKFQNTNWDGKYDYFENGIIDFGLWHECLRCCQEYGYKFQIVNKEQFPRDNDIKFQDVQNFCNEFFKGYKDKNGDPFIPHDHQVKAAFKILKHRYGIIEVATSGGKSLIYSIVLFYLMKKKPDTKALLIVPSIQLVTQFYDDILDYNYGYNKENENPLDIRIDEIMSEAPRKVRDGKVPNVYIGTYQSLINWGTPELQPDFFKQFDVVCVDESHQAGAKSLTEILKRTFGYTKYRFGMSGTFPEESSSELLAIESVTGPKLINIKAKELMDKGIISQLKIKILLLQYRDQEFAQNVVAIKKRGSGKRAYELEKEYIQNSEKRKHFLMKLANKFKHNSLFLFHNIDFGRELYNYFRDNVPGKDFYYIDGEVSGKKRNFIKTEMEKTDGKVKILIASYGTSSTGLSIKSIKNLVFADSFKSDVRIRQSIGRVLRLHKLKDKAIVFDIVDQFYPGYKTVFYNQYLTRKNKIYNVQEFEYEELKVAI